MSMKLSDLQKLMVAEAKEKKIPLSGDFEITPRCNLNCVMCYVRKHPADKLAIEKEMSAEQIISIARQARDMGMLYILLTGGEILVRKDFEYIYEEICKLGLIVTLFTNGTLITKEWADWIATIPPFMVSITMYGASADTYEKVTGNRNGFQLVERAIDMLLEKGIKVELKTAWIKSSVDDYYKLLEFAESKGLQLKIVNYIFPSKENNFSNPIGNRIDPESLAKKENEVEEYARQQSIFTTKEKEVLESEESKNKEFNAVGGAFRCDAGINSFWLSWSGQMLPCGVMSEPRVVIENNDFRRAWELTTQVISRIPTCVDCRTCDVSHYCMSCPARLFAENGSFTQPAEYLCRHAKTRKLLFLK